MAQSPAASATRLPTATKEAPTPQDDAALLAASEKQLAAVKLPAIPASAAERAGIERRLAEGSSIPGAAKVSSVISEPGSPLHLVIIEQQHVVSPLLLGLKESVDNNRGGAITKDEFGLAAIAAFRPDPTGEVAAVQDNIRKILQHLKGSEVYAEGLDISAYETQASELQEKRKRLAGGDPALTIAEKATEEAEQLRYGILRRAGQSTDHYSLLAELNTVNNTDPSVNATAAMALEGKIREMPAELYTRKEREARFVEDYQKSSKEGSGRLLGERTVEGREFDLLHLASSLEKNRDGLVVAVYGRNHDFRNNIAEWNRTHPERKYSLTVITPQGFEDRVRE